MKKQMTKAEIVKQHNYNSGFEPGKMSEYESFDKMPQHIKESYRSDYDIVDDLMTPAKDRLTRIVRDEINAKLNDIMSQYPNLTLNGYLDVREKFDPNKSRCDVDVVLKGSMR